VCGGKYNYVLLALALVLALALALPLPLPLPFKYNIVGFLFLDPSVHTQIFFFTPIVNSPLASSSRHFSLIINPNYLSRV